MSNQQLIKQRLTALTRSSFRAKFHLRGKELAILQEKGIAVIRQHAADLIAKRLAPATLANDGKQTPYKGHPVFVAQHATATCCRSCLLRWHRIAKGKALTQEEQIYVVDVIATWLLQETQNSTIKQEFHHEQ